MSHTLLRSKADKRSLGIYARTLMQLVEAVASGKREEGIAIAGEIQQELRVDLILEERNGHEKTQRTQKVLATDKHG